MPAISSEQLRLHNQLIVSMDNDRAPWLKLFRELSDNFLPQRYRWLMSAKELKATRARRQYIINNTGTQAARVLAAGMMNGITSPSRPWFKLRVPGLKMDEHRPLAVWLEETERRMLQVMAESNFYNSMAVMYLDMAVFGTAANLIYSDFDSVIRCYNPPLGEYMLGVDDRGVAEIFARKFEMKIHQYIKRWPDRRDWSTRVKTAVSTGGAALNDEITIHHFIAPNDAGLAAKRNRYYELYWEGRRNYSEQPNAEGRVLELRGYREKPGIFGRWETSGTDPYGVSPGMDALGDVIELQHIHRNKAELLEKVHKPPLLVDVSLQNNPVAMMPKGVTYVPNLANNTGAKSLVTVNPNFAEIGQDILQVQDRIRNTFFNFLFTGITDLSTVRSAREIDAREGEKLILLGGVLERFESEALDPAITRIFSVSDRAGLLPEPPPGYEGAPLEIQYVSILSVAQRAVGTAPTERWLQLHAEIGEAIPSLFDLTNFDQLLTNYARDIGIRESELASEEEIEGVRQARAQQQAQQQLVDAAQPVTQAAANLSNVDVGGGGDALQQLLGG